MRRAEVLEVLLFDAGNTLVYLDHDALARAGGEAGLSSSGDILRAAEPLAKKTYEAALASGMSHDGGWYVYVETLFAAGGASPEQAQRAARTARAAHDEFNLWRRVPDDLVTALERGKRHGYRYGVVSNSEGKLAGLLERVGLSQFFEVVVDSELEGVRKPDPEIFRRALTRMNVEPELCLYAGDIPNVDVDGARAAGIDAVLIDTLGHYPEYTGAPRYASVAELMKALGV